MPHHDPASRLRHMLDHAREAIDLLRNRTRVELDEDRLLQLAAVRLVEIIGEAAAQVPRNVQE